ncbi:MAG: YjjG family noncanonical pyrimidine nucleotidase [Candidatus Cloacimonetes bacterium]|nr:YjjG family noncanonical pyrimidine nucleotidase [Candidatus Cloacimonadota bacterium]
MIHPHPHWQLVLFDLDGTLLDYHVAARRAFEQTFEAFGLPFEPQFHECFVEINNEMWQLYEQGDITPQELRVRRYYILRGKLGLAFEPDAVSESYLALLGRNADLIHYAMPIVKLLHGKVPLGLITNGFTDVQQSRLDVSGLGRFFPHMACSETAGAAKPQPPIFDLAMHQHGLSDPSRVVIVGDSFASDICGGHDYGMATCWFNPHHTQRPAEPQPTWEIESLEALPTLLEEQP